NLSDEPAGDPYVLPFDVSLDLPLGQELNVALGLDLALDVSLDLQRTGDDDLALQAGPPAHHGQVGFVSVHPKVTRLRRHRLVLGCLLACRFSEHCSPSQAV